MRMHPHRPPQVGRRRRHTDRAAPPVDLPPRRGPQPVLTPLTEAAIFLVPCPLRFTPFSRRPLTTAIRFATPSSVFSKTTARSGYLGHDSDTIQLYIQESMTFHVHPVEAAVSLG